MIFFVWSLVLSAVQYARRQRLMSVLAEYFITNCSRTTVLICRRIPFLSCFSRYTSSTERFAGAIDNALRKTNSEPCLPASHVLTPIYRTEEVEFVVVPNVAQLDIIDWNVFSPPTLGSIPRVYFVAFLGTITESCEQITDEIICTDTATATSSEFSTTSDYDFSSGFMPVLFI
ncbi:unnamed protein product [Gongylonema pulchrum]|uniref:Secreted protein n=1 Tax=Gongylonema pulchrum TaxID=637853 RepID=A0A183EB82_9BILA|nr:unnamed protein product [Gongylonema pulchrum]